MRGGWGRGVRCHAGWPKSNGLDLAKLTRGGNLFPVEEEIYRTGISRPDDDFFLTPDGALVTGDEHAGKHSPSIAGDQCPGILASLDVDEKSSRGRSGG